MKRLIVPFITVLSVLILSSAVSALQQQDIYIVTADIVATTERPGLEYKKQGSIIHDESGLIKALLYGELVKAAPLTDGEFAGRSAEVFNEKGSSIGYVDMAAIAPLPNIDYFPEPEPCSFSVDSATLFLLPGSYSILDYTLPRSEPYFVLMGEVTDGLGTFKDAEGMEWTLLRFGARHAWTLSENVKRLPLYEPDHTKVDPKLVSGIVRGFGPIEDKFRASLLRNGFAIDAAPIIHSLLQVDDLVDSYKYPKTINFVTVDLFLHAFHLIFSRSLKSIEESDFAPTLEVMLSDALSKLEALESNSGKDAEAVFTRARDFLSVPMILCAPGRALSISSERALGEVTRIMKAEGFKLSEISGKEEDYTFYKPRGHYTSSDLLSRYFRAMAYLGGMSIPLNTGDQQHDRENTALIALLCLLFEDENLLKTWGSLYDPMTYMVGEADDPTIRDFSPVVRKFLDGKLDKLTDIKTLDAMRIEFLAARPAPRIISVPTGNVSQKEREQIASGFLLMGRRFVLDAWMFAQLTSPNVGTQIAPRNLPKTADVMAALGSRTADAALEVEKRDIRGYYETLEKVKQAVNSCLEKWDGSFYSAWLGALGIYLTDRDSEQYFWNSPLWDVKKLLTASASWAELKHDTVLYAKQNYAGTGAMRPVWKVVPFENPYPRGYVEPSPRTFEAITLSLSRLNEILKEFELGNRVVSESSWSTPRGKVEAFLKCVKRFQDIAEKEVRGEPLSLDDYKAINSITGYLNEDLLLDTELAAKEDVKQLKMAIVTDVATDTFQGRVLQVATGTPRRLFVFVNDKYGGPRVTIGYTYSFYEFPKSLKEGRMTDDEWRDLVYDVDRQGELEKMTSPWSKDLFSEGSESEDIIRFAIFPTGTTRESYHFVLTRDGVLKCAVGDRNSDDIKQADFLGVIADYSERKLEEADLQTIIDLANKLEASGYSPEKQLWTDSWDVAFLYKGKVYEMNYWQNDDPGGFKNLINKIINLSPIKVDLHGWA